MKYGSYRPHKRVMTDVSAGGRTRQEFADECDVNTIMKKYGRTGMLPQNAVQMRYGEFAEVPDFMTAMNTVARANEAFAALPAAVRRRFGNDPAEFCDFVSDPENIDQVRKMGLAAEVPKQAAAVAPQAGGSPAGATPPPAGLEAPVAPPGAPVPPPAGRG